MPDLEHTATPAATWQAAVDDGRLTYQRCDDCRRAVFYPRLACPGCGSASLHWAQSAGCGAVYSASEIPDRDDTRVVCLVDLDEAFRMMSTISGLRAVEIGTRARAAFEPTGDGSRVVFVADPSA